MKPRKLILSRKGFDSKAGGCPSPIFPDGTMYSLPIPSPRASIAYGDLRHGDIHIGQVVEDLTRRHLTARDGAHLGPDVRPEAYPRQEGWRGLCDQVASAQGHLENQGVGVGDVFLFFGLFRRVEERDTGWRFVRSSPPVHTLWGWHQIEQVCKVDGIRNAPNFKWAFYYDCLDQEFDRGCTLYVASQGLDLGDSLTAAGAGVFPRFDKRLVLTKPGGSVSQWRLPRWFYPDSDRAPLTYHTHDLWQHDDDYAYVQRRGPGQEFVLDLRQYPEACGWISDFVCALGAKRVA